MIIERGAFNYHFKDKYDLVAWIFFNDAFKTDVISVDSSAKGMEQMRKDYLFYKSAYEDTSQNALWQYMHEYFVDRYSQEAKRILKTETLDTQIMYSIRLYCYGGVGMTQEWLMTDNITPAKTVVEMMFNSMPENIRSIFFRNDNDL